MVEHPGVGTESHRCRRCLTVALVLLLPWLGGCAPHRPAPVESRGLKPAAAPARAAHYRVRDGDTLYSIAWRYGLNFRLLAAWNRIGPPYRIYPGQTLRLRPPPAVRPGPVAVKPPNARPVGGGRKKPATTGPVRPHHERPATKVKPVPKAPRSLEWTWPTRGAVVQTYHAADQTRRGIRIAGQTGQPVLAAESGKVVYSGSGLVGYGKLIIIKHNKNYLSAYGFNRKLLVREGDNVTRGERVAEMGRSAEGKAMLHFEIRREGSAVDPLRLLPRR